MSDTPRTDAIREAIADADCKPGCDSHGHESDCVYCYPEVGALEECARLERELAAERKRADEAEAKLDKITTAYKNYRAKGVMPAPNQYALLVKAITEAMKNG